jgi:hypothetical protein
MPMRYGEHVLAAKAGMARAAGVQGRDGPGRRMTEGQVQEFGFIELKLAPEGR